MNKEAHIDRQSDPCLRCHSEKGSSSMAGGNNEAGNACPALAPGALSLPASLYALVSMPGAGTGKLIDSKHK